MPIIGSPNADRSRNRATVKTRLPESDTSRKAQAELAGANVALAADVAKAQAMLSMDVRPKTKPKPRPPSEVWEKLKTPELRAAFERAMNQQAADRIRREHRESILANPINLDQFHRLRETGRLLATLEHDTPQRKALLELAGLNEDQVHVSQLAIIGQTLLHDADVLQELHEGMTKFTVVLSQPNPSERPIVEGLITGRLSDVIPEDVSWLWPQRIPLGSLSIVCGDPDVGKTWAVLDIISRITTGRHFEDDGINHFLSPRNALWISAEDDDATTIRPRIEMIGGDPSRIETLRFVREKGTSRMLNLSQDLERLDNWLIQHPGVSVVAIDPLSAYLGKIDSHRNSDVRSLLSPLTKLAHERNVAIIGVNHLSKSDSMSAMYKGMGSIGFNAAARAVWLVSKDPINRDRRLFTKVKNNLAHDDVGGLAFRIGKAAGGISWEKGRIDIGADQAIEQLSQGSRAPARTEAKDWLRRLLKVGAMRSSEIREKADADRMCWKTVTGAKVELKIKATRVGGKDGYWEWSLPE